MQRFCKEKGIEFTRSRPYRKNDSPYVESKNRSMVRSHTGWRRYDREEEYEIFKRLENLTEELSIAYEKKFRRFKYA
ncbi:MAG: hypothetical protein QW035_04705 [Candidatus Anstonellales archaeon]